MAKATAERLKIERVELTAEMLEGLLDLEHDAKISRADTNGNHEIRLVMTRSESGGRHVYVEDVEDPSRCYHLARNGGATHVEGRYDSNG